MGRAAGETDVRNDAVLPIGRQLLIARSDTGGPAVGSFYQIAPKRRSPRNSRHQPSTGDLEGSKVQFPVDVSPINVVGPNRFEYLPRAANVTFIMA